MLMVLSCNNAFSESKEQSLQALLLSTQQQVEQARAVNGLWRDTEKHIQNAEELIRDGKLDEANELLLQAKLQAELSYQQAVEQKDNVLLPYYLRP